eukprot:TRINITY_DN22501_c0_g1_i1.p1 TRINITY_DN22501_c0_g1~~TRINITY_DN22501_c0_g1_i1.p1  ORF type:complete len:773 (+),score=352.89 TRINITY_DN22501_c0_g1_i1:314-2320(+)
MHAAVQDFREAEAEVKAVKKALERKMVQHELELEKDAAAVKRKEGKLHAAREEVKQQRAAHDAHVRRVRAAQKQHEKEEKEQLRKAKAAYREWERDLQAKEADLARAEKALAELEGDWDEAVQDQRTTLQDAQEQLACKREEHEDEQARLLESLAEGEDAQAQLQADLEQMQARLAAKRGDFKGEQAKMAVERRRWVENAEGAARQRRMDDEAMAWAKVAEEERITRGLLLREEEVNVLRSTIKKKADTQCRSTQKISKMLELFDADDGSDCSGVSGALGRMTISDAVPAVTVTPAPRAPKVTTPRRSMPSTRKRLSFKAGEDSPACSVLSLASLSPNHYVRPSVQTKKVEKIAVDVASAVESAAPSHQSSDLSLDNLMKNLPKLTSSTAKKRPRRAPVTLDDDDEGDCVSQLKFSPVVIEKPAKKAKAAPAPPPAVAAPSPAAKRKKPAKQAKAVKEESPPVAKMERRREKREKPKANPFGFLREDVQGLFAAPKKVKRVSVQRLSTGSDDVDEKLNLSGMSKKGLLACFAGDDNASEATGCSDVRNALGGDPFGASGNSKSKSKAETTARDSFADIERDILALGGGKRRRAASPSCSDVTETLNLRTSVPAPRRPRGSCLATPTGVLRKEVATRRPKQSVRFNSEVQTKRFSLGSDVSSTLHFNFE